MEHIVIPDIYCPFPSLLSPHLEEVAEHALEWVQEMHLVQNETALRYCQGVDLSQFTCRCWPRGNREQLFFICDWWNWNGIYDDQFDDGEQGKHLKDMLAIHNHLLTMLQNTPPVTPQGPVAAALHTLWLRASGLASETWRTRFAQHLAEFFLGQRQEVEQRLDISEMDAYVANRRKTVGISFGFDFLELTLGIDYSTDVYTNALFQNALQIAGDVTAWTNDVYSLPKELACGARNNLVMIVQQAQGCSLQTAITQVCAMVERETRRFQQIVHHFAASTAPDDLALYTYLVDTGTGIRGSLEWSRRTLRYHGDGEEPDRIFSYAGLEKVLPAL
jgi:hypothetical protein